MLGTYLKGGAQYSSKRRYSREDVYIHAQLWMCDGSGDELPVLITELSEGGVALLGDLVAEPGETMVLRFMLPQTQQRIDCEITNVWISAEEGRSGWKIVQCDSHERDELAHWLNSSRRPLGIPLFNRGEIG